MSIFKRPYKEFRIVPYKYGMWAVLYHYRFLFGLIKVWHVARLSRYSYKSIGDATSAIISRYPYEKIMIMKGKNDVLHYITPKKR